MSEFNAQASRAKRPCPIWVDAFQRDTQHLDADEVGAYFLILMAMWTRESCDFPDDDARLARVSRVSTRLWKSRIGPVIRGFLLSADGVVFSKRLREEATYVERQVAQQSDRKTGEKSAKALNNNNLDRSADISTDEPRNHPSQQPNNPTKKNTPLPPKGGGERVASLGRSGRIDAEPAPEAFERFWAEYPHRGGIKRNRKGTLARFAAALKRGVTADEILAGVERLKSDPQVKKGYARDPVTWLNQEGWTDDLPPVGDGGIRDWEPSCATDPVIGDVRRTKSGVVKEYAGYGVGWITCH